MTIELLTINSFFILIYIIINVVVFAMYGIDKWKAIHNKWRIPEATLITVALFGVIGALLGMIVFHHKVRKPKFYISVPAIMILEIVSVVYLTNRF